MEYLFKDGFYSFHAAHYGSWAGDKRVVFRVRRGRVPKVRAAEKGIDCYDRILKASPRQIQAWLDSHPGYPIRVASVGRDGLERKV